MRTSRLQEIMKCKSQHLLLQPSGPKTQNKYLCLGMEKTSYYAGVDFAATNASTESAFSAQVWCPLLGPWCPPRHLL